MVIKTMRTKSLLAAACSLFALSAASHAEAAPHVVASIAPIHSIAAAIMKDVGTPDLLVEQSSSPHATSLRPTGAKALQQADLVIWVGPGLEAFMVKPVETLATKARSLPLIEADGMTILEAREGGNWEKHNHSHEDEEDEDEDHDHEHEHEADHDHDHDHDADHDHDHDADHDHEAEHDHDHGHIDNHVWLDPQNGLAMAAAITKALSEIDPENATQYAANEKAFDDSMKNIVAKAKDELAGVGDKGFIVFHDAYHYLENRFDLHAIGSVTLHPGVNPGAARVNEIQTKLKSLKASCLFSEPQFSSSLLPVLIEGTDTTLSQLDPIGAELQVGPDLYPQLIAYNTKQLSDCLNGH